MSDGTIKYMYTMHTQVSEKENIVEDLHTARDIHVDRFSNNESHMCLLRHQKRCNIQRCGDGINDCVSAFGGCIDLTGNKHKPAR